jgi:hypothetical protein
MTDQLPAPDAPVPSGDLHALAAADRLAATLDYGFRIPLTPIRFGWDPVIGLVPVAGDLVSLALSLRIIAVARGLGASPRTLRRMAYNAGVDAVFGLVPIAGTVFDIYYKANLQNVHLLIEEIARQRGAPDDDSVR